MPIAVISNCTLNNQTTWRVCEGQTKNYAWPLVDDLDELDLLDRILETSKPPMPADVQRHPLLGTPFRYGEQTPKGSRFVRYGAQGALYSAYHPTTCFHEAGHWARQFMQASSGLRDSSCILRRCLFSLLVSGPAIDLMDMPYLADRERWTHPSDYDSTQEIGSHARASGIPLIKYQSVRDPEGQPAVAVMSPDGVSCDKPQTMEDWDLMISPNQLVWHSSKTGLRVIV